MIDEDAELVE